MIKISELNTLYTVAFNAADKYAKDFLESPEIVLLFTTAAALGSKEVFIQVPYCAKLTYSIVMDAVRRELHANGYKASILESRTNTLLVTWNV